MEHLAKKLEEGIESAKREYNELVVRDKAGNFYDFIQNMFGKSLDESISRLGDWEYDANKFQEQLDLHKRIIIQLNELGFDNFKIDDLNKFEKYHVRKLSEAELINIQNQQAALEQKDIRTIDLELQVIQADVHFESDKKLRQAKGEKFVSEYLNELDKKNIGLGLDVAYASLDKFGVSETLHGRYFLLLMLKSKVKKTAEELKAQIPLMEKALLNEGGVLTDVENREYFSFVKNTNPVYSPGIYDLCYSRYKLDKSFEKLKELNNLP